MNVPLVILSPALWLRPCSSVGQVGNLRRIVNRLSIRLCNHSPIVLVADEPPATGTCLRGPRHRWTDPGSGTQLPQQTAVRHRPQRTAISGPFVGCKYDGQTGPVEAPKEEGTFVPINAKAAQKQWTYAGTRRRTSLGAWRRLIQGPPRRGAHAIRRIARSVGRGFPELHRAKGTPVPRCLHSLGEFAKCLTITLARPFLGCLEFLAPP